MTASADRGLRPERVAEIVVALPGEDTGRRGSGYLVSPGTVLTAAHVVQGATDVRVRFQADRPGERIVEAKVVWRHAGIDVAVLTHEGDTDVTPVLFGRVGEQDTVLRCTALGFPRFKLRTDDDGSRFRDAEHIEATCAVLSNRREGTLDLKVGSPPAQDPDPERDAWEGMSGAAVFGNGHLVGLVTHHHRADGPGRIAARRIDRWSEMLDDTERAELEHVLARDLGPAGLPSAAPSAGTDLTQEAYRAQLADVAPPSLEDRGAELRDLVSFSGGPDPYLWLQGPPWAGKTALAAWFALHPPRGVVPVWFFITARYASQSDSDAYTAAVIDQLATIAGREPTGNGSPAARDGERRLLLREAAERVARDGGTLLLVVDGLDEDQSLEPGGSGTCIASLLPERPPPNVRVLVTSRPSPGLPPDVRGDHPLRRCPVVRLSATAASRHTEYEARFDLHQALSGDGSARDLVGLLTAARGTLTADDLRALTGASSYELRRRLGSAFGRILRLRGSGFETSADGDVSLYVSSRGYLFAHDTLLTAAQEELGPDVDGYLERLHAWAESYEQRGWPQDTPPYLLQPYGRLLAHRRDTGRAVAVATDPRRRDRLREATGSDAACLAEIAAARRLVTRDTPGDLSASAALAALADLVARRNRTLHPNVPAGYARTGRVRHAIGLARSVFRPSDRARALAAVAHVLAPAGDRRAKGLAQEALALTREATADRPWLGGDEETDAVLGTLAAVLAATGDEAEVLVRLGELRRPDTGPGVAAFVSAARAGRDPHFAADLLGRAQALARGIPSVPDRVRALAAVAGAWAALGRKDRAAHLHDEVIALAEEHREDPENVPAAAAEVLHDVRPRTAERMVRLAQEHADWYLHSFNLSDHSEAAFAAVCALAATGHADEADRLRQALDAKAMPPPSVGRALAAARARQGRAAEAWAELEAAWETEAPAEEDDFAAHIVRLLTEAGAADELETVLLTGTDTWWWRGVAVALAELAGHFADADPDRSVRLLRQAEHARSLTVGPDDSTQDGCLAALARALAVAGRPDRAERLVEAIGTPDVRAWAWAMVSVALADADPSRALRLAERATLAVPEAGDYCDWVMRAEMLTAVVQAWARAGAVERTLQETERLLKELRNGRMGARHARTARTEVAGCLWRHHPEAAAHIADAVLAELPPGAVPELGRLLAAAAPYDTARAARVLELLHECDTAGHPADDYHEETLLTLLTAALDPEAARHRLDRLASAHPPSSLLSRPGTAEALGRAVLGDHEAARDVALRITAEGQRARTLAALAAHTAGVPVDQVGSPLEGAGRAYETIARRLAAHCFSAPGGPDPARARSLLADALTPDGWHHALPVLARVDPAAVRRVGDVVLAHMGLGNPTPHA
ncbi:trypsin-like peptidase domain-containing protein [Streptomyces massasporeus]|uniref:trypsin-like peptidase domain-containing protein n=1 Tax=Streptomyces massasporeus TaxID=67324 RepID=UPI00381B5920